LVRFAVDDAYMRLSSPRALGRLSVATVVAATSLSMVMPATAADAEVFPIADDGVFRMVGGGWGHGRGMSQWGAYQAASEGRSHAEILAFYYPGTTLATLPDGDVRVLLSSDTGKNLVVRAVPGLTARFAPAGSRAVVLPAQPEGCSRPAKRWRARAVGTQMRLDAKCGTWTKVARRVGLSISFEVAGDVVATINRGSKRGYRGVVSGTYLGRSSVQVVNTVPMEQYLRAVVAAEVSPSWPAASLRAQAIAARTYAATEMRGRAASSFDVYDWVRSQAYPGAVEYGRRWVVTRVREYAATDAAIAQTAGVHVTAGGVPVLTQFSASNGGATAASPLPHMVAVVDPWDAAATRNPLRTWTDTVTAAQLGRWCSSAGPITEVRVLSREGAGQWGGRISRMRVVGTDGSCTLASDSAIRSALGVNSSFLTFTS
jgi:stage II sporulation protein D